MLEVQESQCKYSLRFAGLSQGLFQTEACMIQGCTAYDSREFVLMSVHMTRSNS